MAIFSADKANTNILLAERLRCKLT